MSFRIVDIALGTTDSQKGRCQCGLTCKCCSNLWNLSSIFEDLVFELSEKDEDLCHPSPPPREKYVWKLENNYISKMRGERPE